jgi:Ni,Fe-hydrogenase III small subunit/ferredoxin
MPAPWMLRGLRNGVVTSRWPTRPDAYFDTFPASITVTDNPVGISAHDARRLCPTGAIDPTNGVSVDRGRCILCGHCVEQRPDLFGWRRGAGPAALTRDQLVVPERSDTDEAVSDVRLALAARVGRLRRSVHLRHVDAGSDGSDEWEVQALLNPVYDVHRLGIFFTASPRHADILLVTGVGTAGMVAPLLRTREAMPDPVVVIATGSDAISGGLLGPGYTAGRGVNAVLPVDVFVPGAPASPFSLLHGILLALGRLPAAAQAGEG